MTTATPTLFDDVFAAFRLACAQQQYGVAEHLLAALEQLAGDKHRMLDEVYLSFASNCPAGSAMSDSTVSRAR
ncbi:MULTISPECIES: hypothetical protein [Cupriavidus]|jgi:hypothetical protein|uniref:Uncharacterized protein n=3 Tax=Cupriavidus TaxID=106589 RepID=A0A375CJM0_9BURK|nr:MULTISPECIES: hypothetical protein [Cupriavidus]QQE07998.1 hypothetical protein IC580_06880 [Cupriavidus sp. ISTL7]SOY73103.1 hypothetical protein CBM2587_P10035 [Cupriavidus taiwanensis]MCT9016867.1 hypothetical protein [Cupriavidus gilardii]MCT9056563.1 hypothetical protein [Cupriavidus gilardii]NSX05535.1 hypothetical protein [Cupriavidus gilardii]